MHIYNTVMKTSQVLGIFMYFYEVIIISRLQILYKERNMTKILIDKVIVYKFMFFKIWIFPKQQK